MRSKKDLPIQNCEICKGNFRPSRKGQKYCYRIMKKKCLFCKNRFEITSYCKLKAKGQEKNYCSSECAYKAPKSYLKICSFCGEEFIAKNHNGIFCNKPDLILKCSEPYCEEIRIIKTPCKNGKNKDSKVYCRKHIASRAAKIQNEKNKEKMMKEYGVEYFVQTEVFKQKSKETNLRKYGKEHTLQVKSIRDKGIETNLKKYGVTNAGASKEVQEKIKETMIKNFGSHYFQTEQFKEKSKKTNLRKYGVINGGGSKQSILKAKNTNLKKYGVDNPMKSKLFKEKVNNKYIENNHINQVSNYEEWIDLKNTLSSNKNKDVLYWSKYFNVNPATIRKKVIKEKIEHLIKDFYSFSNAELKFREELIRIGLIEGKDFYTHNKNIINPLEIDFFLPKHNLAIEINPTTTHNYNPNNENYIGVQEKDYHYKKYKLCQEKNIELISVFDWSPIDRIISFIKDKVKQNDKIVYARNCKNKLVEGVNSFHKNFLNENHILGSIYNRKNSVTLELFNEDEIVGLAIFIPLKENQLELKRLVFKSNIKVIGGASKLIKNIIKLYPNINEIITFSDNDLGTGNVYKTLGFEIIEENKGTLIWYNEKEKKKIPNLSLVRQGADRLLKNFPGYSYVGQGDNLPTNQEIIASYGFLPIYDCGYTKWKYLKK